MSCLVYGQTAQNWPVKISTYDPSLNIQSCINQILRKPFFLPFLTTKKYTLKGKIYIFLPFIFINFLEQTHERNERKGKKKGKKGPWKYKENLKVSCSAKNFNAGLAAHNAEFCSTKILLCRTGYLHWAYDTVCLVWPNNGKKLSLSFNFHFERIQSAGASNIQTWLNFTICSFIYLINAMHYNHKNNYLFIAKNESDNTYETISFLVGQAKVNCVIPKSVKISPVLIFSTKYNHIFICMYVSHNFVCRLIA